MEFVLNKERVEVLGIDADTTVLNLLRQKGLVGTKEGCASGDCGACTVMLGAGATDGQIEYKTINACIALAGSLAGKHVVTVEGLQNGTELHPAQRFMVEHHASQCGYCTPGFVMSLANLVEEQIGSDQTGENLSEIVITGISGNLCRCTGYRPIVDAGVSALAARRPPSVCHDEAREFLQNYKRGYDREQDIADGNYHRPRCLEDLDRLVGVHGNQYLVAGATDFGLEITQRWTRFPVIIDISEVIEMRDVGISDDEISIGACVSYSQIEQIFAERSAAFVHLLLRLGSRQIRNTGTLGGNIGNASPIADTPPVLIVWEAILELRDARGQTREVSVEEFFVSYRKTILANDEYIVRVMIPAASVARFHRFYKHSKRIEDDISSVMGAFSIWGDDKNIAGIRISYGGMAAVPVRLHEIETMLVDTPLDIKLVDEACASLRTVMTPMTDVRASAGFRMDMAVEMLDRALREYMGEALPRVDDLP
ncbi:MAG: xanthine dehydrogenase small subunit [Proteobacteria bacterium]|nr:xanthine dehydrogenase small subunit [Pseudomonadota bacterium]